MKSASPCERTAGVVISPCVLAQADDEALTRKRAAFVARRAGPPPAVAPLAWSTFLDLYELLNEFAVFLIEVRYA